jgi:hypothetical protein
VVIPSAAKANPLSELGNGLLAKNKYCLVSRKRMEL